MSETAPDYEAFTTRIGRGRGWAMDFLADLVAGVPRRLPEERQSRPNARTVLYGAATARGLKVAIRTVDGKLWARRLKDEDA